MNLFIELVSCSLQRSGSHRLMLQGQCESGPFDKHSIIGNLSHSFTIFIPSGTIQQRKFKLFFSLCADGEEIRSEILETLSITAIANDLTVNFPSFGTVSLRYRTLSTSIASAAELWSDHGYVLSINAAFLNSLIEDPFDLKLQIRSNKNKEPVLDCMLSNASSSLLLPILERLCKDGLELMVSHNEKVYSAQLGPTLPVTIILPITLSLTSSSNGPLMLIAQLVPRRQCGLALHSLVMREGTMEASSSSAVVTAAAGAVRGKASARVSLTPRRTQSISIPSALGRGGQGPGTTSLTTPLKQILALQLITPEAVSHSVISYRQQVERAIAGQAPFTPKDGNGCLALISSKSDTAMVVISDALPLANIVAGYDNQNNVNSKNNSSSSAVSRRTLQQTCIALLPLLNHDNNHQDPLRLKGSLVSAAGLISFEGELVEVSREITTVNNTAASLSASAVNKSTVSVTLEGHLLSMDASQRENTAAPSSIPCMVVKVFLSFLLPPPSSLANKTEEEQQEKEKELPGSSSPQALPPPLILHNKKEADAEQEQDQATAARKELLALIHDARPPLMKDGSNNRDKDLLEVRPESIASFAAMLSRELQGKQKLIEQLLLEIEDKYQALQLSGVDVRALREERLQLQGTIKDLREDLQQRADSELKAEQLAQVLWQQQQPQQSSVNLNHSQQLLDRASLLRLIAEQRKQLESVSEQWKAAQPQLERFKVIETQLASLQGRYKELKRKWQSVRAEANKLETYRMTISTQEALIAKLQALLESRLRSKFALLKENAAELYPFDNYSQNDDNGSNDSYRDSRRRIEQRKKRGRRRANSEDDDEQDDDEIDGDEDQQAVDEIADNNNNLDREEEERQRQELELQLESTQDRANSLEEILKKAQEQIAHQARDLQQLRAEQAMALAGEGGGEELLAAVTDLEVDPQGRRPAAVRNLRKANLKIDQLVAEGIGRAFRINALESQLESSARESAREAARLRTRILELEVALSMLSQPAPPPLSSAGYSEDEDEEAAVVIPPQPARPKKEEPEQNSSHQSSPSKQSHEHQVSLDIDYKLTREESMVDIDRMETPPNEK